MIFLEYINENNEWVFEGGEKLSFSIDGNIIGDKKGNLSHWSFNDSGKLIIIDNNGLIKWRQETCKLLGRSTLSFDGEFMRIEPNKMKYYSSVVVCARWEHKYILEWINYYKIIGYDHIYIYCNDDDPYELYNSAMPFCLGERPFVTFVHFKGVGMQHQMYLHFLRSFSFETQWVSFFDVDEFLYLPKHKKLTAFLKEYKEADCILFYWLVFGDSGNEKTPQGYVLDNYNKRSKNINGFTKFICLTSKLMDNKIFSPDGYGFWHNPKDHLYNNINIVDVINRKNFSVDCLSQEESSEIINTATIHHYMIKSREYLDHRVKRSTSGAFSGQIMWDSSDSSRKEAIERSLIEFNSVTDNSLCNFWKDIIIKNSNSIIVPKNSISKDLKLISRNKPCNQSSISFWSSGSTTHEDASNAVNGVINGFAKFHTDLEDNPWWEIDLQEIFCVKKIIIYNVCNETANRCKNVKIDFSCDGSINRPILFEKKDDVILGGFLDNPLDIDCNVFSRYIRITNLDRNFLHLDQIEVYAELK
ncbi:glycosyltransferase family 2 protein [Gluconobacter japonicus]|uniref:glycosyltransferase family 2 protein n=1 Tax=Gluconobacter japonicus TaxID=376620 RepID=UPI003D29980F